MEQNLIYKDARWIPLMGQFVKHGSLTGDNMPKCENCGKQVQDREFAHLGKTGQKSLLRGMGRGRNNRILDFIRHYNDYGLFCHDCHQAYDGLRHKMGPEEYQKFKDSYVLAYPDKQVRQKMRSLKAKRRQMARPVAAGGKVYLAGGEEAPKGSQEERGPKGGRFYRKEQGAEAADIIGDPEDTDTFDPVKYTQSVKDFDMEDFNNMEKNFYKSDEFKQADPFGAAFRKNIVKIEDAPADMGRGGQAIDLIVRGAVNHGYDGIIKAEAKTGRRIYVKPGEAAPPGMTLYRGGHGGRFYYDKEAEDDGARGIADKVKGLTEKVEKEYNNLGNVGKLREVGAGKPDLPQNQGVLKGTSLAVEYSKKPESPKFDLPQQPVSSKEPKLSAAKSMLKTILKSLNAKIAKEGMDPSDPIDNRYGPKRMRRIKADYQPKKLQGDQKLYQPKPLPSNWGKFKDAPLQKQNMPSLNPTENPMTGMGNKIKAQSIKNKLQAGFQPASKPSTPTPKINAGRNMEPPKMQSPSMRSRGPRNLPFAQFSLADRIAKYIAKHS